MKHPRRILDWDPHEVIPVFQLRDVLKGRLVVKCFQHATPNLMVVSGSPKRW